jgi:hypothetical protein
LRIGRKLGISCEKSDPTGAETRHALHPVSRIESSDDNPGGSQDGDEGTPRRDPPHRRTREERKLLAISNPMLSLCIPIVREKEIAAGQLRRFLVDDAESCAMHAKRIAMSDDGHKSTALRFRSERNHCTRERVNEN